MARIGTVLCPIETPIWSRRGVALAARIASTFGARVVLHHDLTTSAPEFLGMGWMEAAERRGSDEAEVVATKELFREILATLPKGLPAEERVTRGGRAASICGLARTLPAELVVMATHDRIDPERESLTERILDGAPCPVLVTHCPAGPNDCPDPLVLHPDERIPAVVPVDFSPHSLAALRYAFDLVVPLHLDLCVVEIEGTLLLEDLRHASDPGVDGHRRQRVLEHREKLASLVPAELANRVRCEVRLGHPVPEILESVAATGAGLVVMGTHGQGLLRRLWHEPTSSSVLREAGCPVWFVPIGSEVAVTPLAAMVAAQ
jgi:nucleotide-binding universal stress UspA family protein